MKTLREKLDRLKKNNCLVGIKGGTEIEAMTFEEIYFMKKISEDIVPMTVKIGGPEARNDIEYMLSIGIEKILAPMVESPYSLKNFVETMLELDKNSVAKLAINIETIFSYKNLDLIFQSPFFWHINHVTVGRTDLSGSINKNPDDPEVLQMTKNIIELSKVFNKTTSVGGKINTHNSQFVKSTIGSDYLNTRHMVISCKSLNISESISLALNWEKDFYQFLKEKYPLRVDFYNKRIYSLEERIDTVKTKETCKVLI